MAFNSWGGGEKKSIKGSTNGIGGSKQKKKWKSKK
jgi:hypothetical protein